MSKLTTSQILESFYDHDESVLAKQIRRFDKLIKKFKNEFSEDTVHFFSTPGRVEIGGNHTDHNHGQVLAAAINLDTVAAVAPSGDDQVVLYSDGYLTPFRIDLSGKKPVPEEMGSTTGLIRGIASRFDELVFNVGGFHATMSSQVLVGSGLSSSASIEVLIGMIFNTLFNDGCIPPETIAKIGQFAENQFFGKPCGLMDQTACAVGGIVQIDFEKPEVPVIHRVEFELDHYQYSLIVVDSGGSHEDLTDDYASIPEEMKSVAHHLGAQVCRDITRKSVINNIKVLRDKVGDRALLRALHFFAENDRVEKQVSALTNGELKTFLKLVNESGNSSYRFLQNIYSLKNMKEQSLALTLESTEHFIQKIGEGACRVHGGGFAGTILAFLPSDSVDAYKKCLKPFIGEEKILELQIRQTGTAYLGSRSVD